MQAFLAMWGDWFQKHGPAIADGGDGLKRAGKILQPGGIVSDGPYIEAKEIIGGYSVVEAADLDAAVAIASDCPIALVGGAIEVRELAGYN
jgi:hypothetical protein